MGNGIAQVAATSGYQVTCMDVMPAALEKAKAAIAKSTAKLLEKGTLTPEQKDAADKIAYVGDMNTMKDADFLIHDFAKQTITLISNDRDEIYTSL